MTIYPIPAGSKLSVGEIAEHWSKEMRPQPTVGELADAIIAAWWRGELSNPNGVSRLDAVKGIYRFPSGSVIFSFPGATPPSGIIELEDGGCELDLTPVVNLPNQDVESWNETSCNAAFQTIAGNWDSNALPLIAPVLWGLKISECDFSVWLKRRGTERPEFWGKAKRTTRGKSPSNIQSHDAIKKWIEGCEPTNMKDARKAYSAQFPNAIKTAAFDKLWNEVKKNKPGRPRKAVGQ